MKARLFLFLALLLICTGAALAQTPDGETPAGETVCDSETGAAYGLCTAYCEAMDCESDEPAASETACTKVQAKFLNITGRDLPCEAAAVTCPCSGNPAWEAVLTGGLLACSAGGDIAYVTTSVGTISVDSRPGVAGCEVAGGFFLPVSPEEAAVCGAVIDDNCPEF